MAETPALTSISIGGSQILVSNFHKLGYGSPREMFDAFQSDERFHVLGFLDFCGTTLLDDIKANDWVSFAGAYNGAAPRIQSPDLLAAAGSIVHVEGRHAGALRELAGKFPAPGAFDRSLTRAEATAAVKPYVTG